MPKCEQRSNARGGGAGRGHAHFRGDELAATSWVNKYALFSLSRFIPDGTQAAGRKCPEHGDADGLCYEVGCLKCKSRKGTNRG